MKIAVIFVVLEVIAICSQADSETVWTSSYTGEKVINLPEYEPVFIAFRCDVQNPPNGFRINVVLKSGTSTYKEIRFFGLSTLRWHMIMKTRKFMLIAGRLIELRPSVAQTAGWTLTVSSNKVVKWDTEKYSNIFPKCAAPEVTEAETTEDAEAEITGKDIYSILMLVTIIILGLACITLLICHVRLKKQLHEAIQGAKTSDAETHDNIQQDAQAVEMGGIAPGEIEEGLVLAAPRMPEGPIYQNVHDAFQVAIASGATSRISEEPIYEN